MVLTFQCNFKHSDTSSVWFLKIPEDFGATFAGSSFDYPFKQSNILFLAHLSISSG